MISHKRTERFYREEGLSFRRRGRCRKRAAGARVNLPLPQRPNQSWSMDFATDTIVTGRRFRALAVIDDYSRECPAIEVDTSLGGVRVVDVLDRLADTRGLPEVITMDNRPEFAGRLRDECLNDNWFMSVRHARDVIETWRLDFNDLRPHS